MDLWCQFFQLEILPELGLLCGDERGAHVCEILDYWRTLLCG